MFAALSSRRHFIAAAGILSALALVVALIFQYGFGFRPCQLCIVQRWFHGAVIAFSLIAWFRPGRAALSIASAAAFWGGVASAYHAGVEWGFWRGLPSCSGGSDLSRLDAADLLSTSGAGMVSCSDPAWVFAGLSMAGWDAVLFAFIFLILEVAASDRSKREPAKTFQHA